jgi:hypothetical protein
MVAAGSVWSESGQWSALDQANSDAARCLDVFSLLDAASGVTAALISLVVVNG